MTKPLFIVDDWGMSPAINEAALFLAQQGWLYGISVIARSRFYAHQLQEVLACDVKVGCHLNLTFDLNPALPESSTWLGTTQQIAKALGTGLFFNQKISIEINQQVDWVRKHIGRLDYLDGHHHIHLYPGVLKASQAVAAYNQIPLRVVTDSSFKSNYGLALWAKWALKKSDYFECLYLNQNDIETDRNLRAKALNTQELPVAVHPATRNDFAENKVADLLSADRVIQFEKIKSALL